MHVIELNDAWNTFQAIGCIRSSF